MLRKNFIKRISILCVLSIFGISYSATASTENAESNINKSIEKIFVDKNEKVQSLDTINNNNLQPKTSISKFNSTNNSQTLVNDAVISLTDSLTTEDNNDFWFFNVNSDRTMLMNLRSNNTNYIAQLGIVDWTEGTFTPTNIYVTSGTQLTLRDLPVGDYGILVYSSTDSVGDNYTLGMNALNPTSSSTAKINYSTSLSDVQIQYDNSDVYYNGKLVCNLSSTNANLKWVRNYTFSYGGNYNTINHDVDTVKVKSILGAPVKYHSAYANSNHALLLVLDKGTLFTYFRSAFQSGPPTYHEMSFEDLIGKTTPRYFDDDDMNVDNYGYHILVYDLDTQKAIDFYSILNYWYASGNESQPTITAIS